MTMGGKLIEKMSQHLQFLTRPITRASQRRRRRRRRQQQGKIKKEIKSRVSYHFVIINIIFISLVCLNLNDKLVKCHEISQTIKSNTEFTINQLPSQLFQSSQAEQLQAHNNEHLSAIRQSKRTSEEEDGFIMKTPQHSDQTVPSQPNVEAETTTLETTQLSADTSTSSDAQTNNEMPTTKDQPSDESDDDRIAINATRQQFLTHDQLLNAATKDEPIFKRAAAKALEPSISSSRLAFASSFISDLLFRSRQSQQQQQQNHQPATSNLIESIPSQDPGLSLNSKNINQATSCPGVCLSLFVAPLRCQNAIQAPCPSLLQKCCEMGDVSFNGTPVETSAPISSSDPEFNSVQAARGATQNSSQPEADEPASVSPTLRLQPSPASEPQQQTNEQQSVSTPGLSSNPASNTNSFNDAQRTTQNADQQNESADQQESRPKSVYFLSSGNDEGTVSVAANNAASKYANQDESDSTMRHRQQQETDSKHLGQEQSASVWLPPKSTAQPANESVAQSVGNQSAFGKSQPDLSKAAASQSFDPPLTITTISPIASTSKPPTDRLVLIQTANGTTYLHSSHEMAAFNRSQLARPIRPLYANWTDYQLLMLQSRPLINGQQQQQHQNQGPVIYHSNTVPVRNHFNESTNISGGSGNAFAKSDDLNNQNLKNKSDQPGVQMDSIDMDTKVIKDQHSSSSSSSRQQNTISTQTSTISTSTPSSQQPEPTSTIAEQLNTFPNNEHQNDSATTSTTSTDPPMSSLADESAGQANQASDEQQQQQQVSGIANFLGSLFDTFMSSTGADAGSSVSTEARGSHEQTSQALPTDDNFNIAGEQQNDRRLGLDLSFRQQNNDLHQLNSSQASGDSSTDDTLINGDGSLNQEQDSQAQHSNPDFNLPRCAGYCSLDQFLHLCDSHYSAGDCAQYQKCCMTSSSANQDAISSTNNNRQQQQQQQQVCRGTCLPVYHSSLCMKPNQIQLDSPSCLPDQLCCSQAASNQNTLIDGSNFLEATSGAGDNQSSSGISDHQIHGGSLFDGSIAKDQSLSAALVPPPPPTVLVAQSSAPSIHLDQQQQTNGRQVNQIASNPYQSSQMAQYPQSMTQRPINGAGPTIKSSVSDQQQQPNGGIMNQLFSMFKSNTGLGKQRPSKKQPAPLNQVPQAYHELAAPSQNSYQTVSMAPQIAMARPATNVAGQIVFPHTALMTPNSPSSGPNGPLLVGPNGQPFIATQMAQQQQQQQQQQKHNAFAPTNFNPVANLDSQKDKQQQISMDQLTQFYQNEPNQFATMIQKQFIIQNQQPSRQQPQYQMQVSPSQHNNHMQTTLAQPQQQRPYQSQPHSTVVDMTRNGEQQIFNQRNPIPTSMQQPQQLPVSTFQQNNNQATRWTQLGQQHEANDLSNAPIVVHQNNNNNRQQVNTNSRPQYQQPHQTHTQQRQQQRWPASQASNPLSFVAADAAAPINWSANNRPEQQRFGWTATNQQPVSGHNSAEPEQQRQQQQQNRAKLGAPDANVVALQQESVPNAGIKQIIRQSNDLQQHQSALFPSRSTQQSGGLQTRSPTLASTTSTTTTTTSTTQATPLVLTAIEGSLLSSSSSNLSPVHVNSASSTQTSGSDNRVGSTTSQLSSTQTDDSGDMHDEIADEQDQRQPCKWSCLAPMLSFNCVRPNYIDLNLACPTTGGVCCVKAEQVFDNNTDNGTELKGSSSSSHTQHMSPASSQADYSIDSALGSGNFGEIVVEDQSDLMMTSDQQPQPSRSQQQATGNQLDSAASASTGNSNDRPVEVDPAPVKIEAVAATCGVPANNLGRTKQMVTNGRQGRVMGGFDSEPGYWCWQAALMNGKNEYLCGGALIGTKWVLTAAHCITQHLRSENQLFVRLGQWNLNSTSASERRRAKSFLVKTSYVHHNHNGITLDNDIALLRLDDSVDLSEPSICTVCLPGQRSSTKQLEIGKRCTVTGYGFESETGPAALRVRQTDLPLVSDLVCQNKTSLALGKPFVLPASSFCAGGELGQDACHGDGGSPLSCLVDGYYELAGIVSWGYKCGHKDLPGLYAKVSSFVGWINQIVSVNS